MNNVHQFKDKIIIVLCLMSIALSWFFIFNLQYIKNYENENEIIGKVIIKGQSVRKKNAVNYFWQNTKNSTNLNKGDSLFAGLSSSASVELTDGSKLLVGENSLVKFENKKNQLSIDINFGQVQIDSKAKFIKIKNCGKDILIETNDAVFDLNKGNNCGEINVKVRSGEIKLVNKIIKKTTHSAKIKLNNDLNINVLIKPPVLIKQSVILPLPTEITAYTQVSKTGLLELIVHWASVSAAATYELEVSPDVNMEVNKKTYTVSSNQALIPNLISDKMYFRIRAVDTELNKSAFTDTSAAKLKNILNAPVIKSVVFKPNSINSMLLFLNWHAVDKASEYTIELGADKNFKNIITKNVKATSIVFADIDKTFIFVRLRAINKYESSDNSKVVSAFYNHRKIASVDNVKIEKCFIKQINENGSPKEFNVQWGQIAMAQSYNINMLDINNNIILQTSTRQPASDLQVPSCGEYTVKVEALDSAGRKISSEFNAARIIYKKTLIVAPPIIPAILQNTDVFFQSGHARFVWLKWHTSMKEKSLYQIEISSDESFNANSKIYEVNESQFLLKSKLESGKYFWRVRQKQHSQFSDWSDTASIKVITTNTK